MSITGDRALREIERLMAAKDVNGAELVLRAFAADAAFDRVSADTDDYRVLADALSATMPNGDAWDGDDAEVSILTEYVQGFEDMVRHMVAEFVRTNPLHVVRNAVREYIADSIDPFRRCDGADCTGDAAHWRRKSDGTSVHPRLTGEG